MNPVDRPSRAYTDCQNSLKRNYRRRDRPIVLITTAPFNAADSADFHFSSFLPFFFIYLLEIKTVVGAYYVFANTKRNMRRQLPHTYPTSGYTKTRSRFRVGSKGPVCRSSSPS